MSVLQEAERVNEAAEWPDKPAIYSAPPQDDTARFYHKYLMKLLRGGKKLDTDDWGWMNKYNKFKSRSRNKEEIEEYEEEHTKKDMQLFFMDKISTLQNSYEERILKVQLAHQQELQKKDKRIDELTASAEKRRDDQATEIYKMLSQTYRDTVQTVEKAHHNSNANLTKALDSSSKLNETLTSGFTEKATRFFDKEKKHSEEIERLLEKRDEPGWIETILNEVILPNKDKFAEALSSAQDYLLPKK